jgi:hypothetical protein
VGNVPAAESANSAETQLRTTIESAAVVIEESANWYMPSDQVTKPYIKVPPRFAIKDSFCMPAGTVARFKANIESLKLLKDLASFGREPNDVELSCLAQYSGWGGLSEAFGGTKSYWDERRIELRNVLNEVDYEAARSSVLNAHYTAPGVIRWMYSVLKHLGFNGGRVLDPCTGIGHFIGAMPEDIRTASDCTLVELNGTSAAIAKALYPDCTVLAQGLETTQLPEDHFDAVISNVPFGEYTVHDPSFRSRAPLIHDYFFEKATRLVRPGGLIAFITSTGTLDKLSKNVRMRLRSSCDLIGAFRLPSSAFESTASTEVVTDVIFLRRRLPHEQPSEVSWLESVPVGNDDERRYSLNEYFRDRPENVIGKLSFNWIGSRCMLSVKFDGSMLEALAERTTSLPSAIYEPKVGQNLCSTSIITELDVSLKPNSFFTKNGAVLKVGTDGRTATAVSGLGAKSVRRVTGLIGVRDAMKDVLRTQVENESDEVIEAAIERLNRRYDLFAGEFGILHDRQNRRAFKGDPDLPSLLALEDYDDDEGTAQKMPIFKRRTIMPSIAPTSVDSAQDALLVSLNWKGRVDPEYICSLLPRRNWDAISSELTANGLAWLDPESQQWVPREVYLAGNVRKKLRVAQHAALMNPYFEAHATALAAIIPSDLSPGEIAANLGAVWIPKDVVLAFAKELLNTSHISIHHSPSTATWRLDFEPLASHLERNNVENTSVWERAGSLVAS